MTDEYQSIPVADARAAVQASGELVAFKGPEFWQGSRDTFDPWLPMFSPTEEKPHPEFARVIIARREQEPREVVISWDEYAAELELDDPEWLEKRRQKPMAIFGAEVERHAYRVVFADVLAAAFPPARVAPRRCTEAEPRAAVAEVVPEPEPERDWFAEVKAADVGTLNGLYDEAREAGALVKVEGLQVAFSDRLLELTVPPKPKPAALPSKPVEPRPSGQRRRRGKR
ncbi:hypothetical protein J2Y69_002484 [Microbacterium resistens]|uniref:Uncharacterized protein n=1 Tax=Microbacterium resistens TaxID=156977 RepID=A0ABU1SE54_9MICO|nr:hypothetical protein [Microbacterium resistens]MDR6867876.1 hypothetical protein [Microbacterium resistens]